MRKDIYTSLRRTSSLLAIAGLLASPGAGIGAIPASVQNCEAQASDLVARISALKSRSDDESGKVKSDFSSATSSSYSSNYFKKFDSWNSGVTEASKLKTVGYDLTNFIKPMSEGQQQTKLPPTATNTMTNGIELAKAAADEDNTRLDLAQLRCDQSTENTALDAFLKQASGDTASSYKSAKYNICRIVQVIADLQDKKQKLDQLRKNGYPLFFLHEKDKKTFGGTYERTIQFKVDLRLYPIYPDTKEINGGDQKFMLGSLEGIKLSYNSYFKFSDDDWTKLNLYQYFISDPSKGQICPVKLDLTNSVNVKLCIDPQTITDTSIKVRLSAKFHYKGDDKSVVISTVTIPAPFGYLADVSDMKEKKMQDLKSMLVDRLVAIFKDYSDLSGRADTWKKQCA